MAARLGQNKAVAYHCILIVTVFILCNGGVAKTAVVPIDEESNQGRESGGRREGEGTDDAQLVEVYVVPHSHMDVGWVYTVQVSLYNLCQYPEVG